MKVPVPPTIHTVPSSSIARLRRMHVSMLRRRVEGFPKNERRGEGERTYRKTDSSGSIGGATVRV